MRYPKDVPLMWKEVDRYLESLPEGRETRKWRNKAEARRLKYGPDAICLINQETLEFLQ